MSEMSNIPTMPRCQTPLKSPSPDQSRMNVLTPTKVKYLNAGFMGESGNKGKYQSLTPKASGTNKKTEQKYSTNLPKSPLSPENPFKTIQNPPGFQRPSPKNSQQKNQQNCFRKEQELRNYENYENSHIYIQISQNLSQNSQNVYQNAQNAQNVSQKNSQNISQTISEKGAQEKISVSQKKSEKKSQKNYERISERIFQKQKEKSKFEELSTKNNLWKQISQSEQQKVSEMAHKKQYGFQNQNFNGNEKDQLLKEIEILKIQNRNLVRKITILENNSLVFENQRKSGTIMQKIKEQYNDKIQTLKIMIEQEIKQAMDVVQDMCQILRRKMKEVEIRVQHMQGRIAQIKVERIAQFQKTMNLGQRAQLSSFLPYSTQKSYKSQSSQSLSDILCKSIPEEENEQSMKNSATENTELQKMQIQVSQLQKTITQTQEVYSEEKRNFGTLLQQKDKTIQELQKQIQKLRQNLQIRKSYTVDSKISQNFKNELQYLQKCSRSLAQELQQKQIHFERTIKNLQAKSLEIEILSNDNQVLRDKVINSEKCRILLQQKITYLQGCLQLLEQENKNKKDQLQKIREDQFKSQKQNLSNLKNPLFKTTSSNLLNLSSRIQKLLQLEQRRQNQQKSLIESQYHYQSQQLETQLQRS